MSLHFCPFSHYQRFFSKAATKKHEAIETDIFAYEERVQAVVAVAGTGAL